jgi:hypothetical protein
VSFLQLIRNFKKKQEYNLLPPTIRKNSENSKNLVFLPQLGAQQLELGMLHWFLLFWQTKQGGFKRGV